MRAELRKGFLVGVRWVLLGTLYLQPLMAQAQGATPEDLARVKAELMAAHTALADPNAPLEPNQRQTLVAKLAGADAALERYQRLTAQGRPRAAATLPLYATGGGLLLDDVTVAGIADDVFVPFVALGVLVAHLTTQRPASSAELAAAWRAVLRELDAAAQTATTIHQMHHAPPKKLNAFPDTKLVEKRKTPVQKGGGLRKRWVDTKGQIYEWDSQHGTVEKYDPRGRHLGEYDPMDGHQVKGPQPGRRVEP